MPQVFRRPEGCLAEPQHFLGLTDFPFLFPEGRHSIPSQKGEERRGTLAISSVPEGVSHHRRVWSRVLLRSRGATGGVTGPLAHGILGTQKQRLILKSWSRIPRTQGGPDGPVGEVQDKEYPRRQLRPLTFVPPITGEMTTRSCGPQRSSLCCRCA